MRCKNCGLHREKASDIAGRRRVEDDDVASLEVSDLLAGVTPVLPTGRNDISFPQESRHS